ncbi:MAG: hypothetical protein GX264_08470 [Clostridiales bacterium]|jgi:hypothetical protein|nr:hypothetical protein [Clostridiales bacterium]
MANVNVDVIAQALQDNDVFEVVDITFTYEEETEQNGSVIYYGATLTDGTVSEDVLFSQSVTPGTDIPETASFAYEPTVAFTGTITGNNGKVYYTA